MSKMRSSDSMLSPRGAERELFQLLVTAATLNPASRSLRNSIKSTASKS